MGSWNALFCIAVGMSFWFVRRATASQYGLRCHSRCCVFGDFVEKRNRLALTYCERAKLGLLGLFDILCLSPY